MKRPQSAKPGYKASWGQSSQTELGYERQSGNDNPNQNVKYNQYQVQNNNHSNSQARKNIKLVKPDLTTNDYARILPKKIYQDKQRLYSQTLQLKQSLNQTVQENVRLKTRIAILEKENVKITKNINNDNIGLRENSGNKLVKHSNNLNSRANIYNHGTNKVSQKQNMVIVNLKKMIRQKKQQNDYLNQQNLKIKKSIKYTKINQLEIQRKMLQQQNKRIVTILEDMNNQLINQDLCERQLNSFRKALEQQQNANQQLNQANLKYMEYIEQLQEKLQVDNQKHQNKQNKLQRQLALNKRKMNQALKQAQDLRKQLNLLKNQSKNSQNQSQRTKVLARPISSNPNNHRSQDGILGVRTHNTVANNNKSQQQSKTLQNMKSIQIQNLKLKQELNKTKQRLQQTQRKMIQQQQKSRIKVNQNKKQPKSQSKIEVQSKVQQNKNNESPIKQKNKIDQSYEQKYDNQNGQQDYYDQFQQNNDEGKINQNGKINIKNQKKQAQSQLEQFKKDFQAQQEQQQLFVKDQNEKKKNKKQKIKNKDQSINNDKKKKSIDKKSFKPDKKALTQIKQLLTYRMKAQRYPYNQLKKDIQDSKQQSFTITQLKAMFTNQPFYLTQKLSQVFMKYCFQKQVIKEKQILTLSSKTLLQKIRKVVQDFKLVDQKQEEQMLLRIAQMVSEYPQQLQSAFQKIKNSQDTVQKDDLFQMFKNLQLDDKYIQMIIQQLSLCSADLHHLNFHGFFQRFYVQNLENMQQMNGQIDEQQIQSSSQQVTKNLKQKKQSKKLKKIKQQFQDSTDKNLKLDHEERISLGNQDYGDYIQKDSQIVSDDGPI